MKNILVTGANGQLGNEMRVLSAEYKEYTCFFTDVAELDICDGGLQRSRSFFIGLSRLSAFIKKQNTASGLSSLQKICR